MKRIIACVLMILILTGCGEGGRAEQKEQSQKLQIVATLFPQYDFARAIAGDRAEVTLLLPPGADSHSYEPTPADMIKINEADLFIYTGEAMEGWVSGVLSSLEGDPLVLDISRDIPLCEGHHHEGEQHYNVDPHIFTNPRFAIKMAENLEKALCEADPAGKEEYVKRGEAFRRELEALDREFTSIVAQGKRNKLIFGGRFAFLYFTEAYGLTYETAYDSCSADAEPSASDLMKMIETVKGEGIPVVYYEELSNTKTAQLIQEETGAKLLLLHSCHNISKDEMEQGVTYLGLMRQNAEHLKEGLN